MQLQIKKRLLVENKSMLYYRARMWITGLNSGKIRQMVKIISVGEKQTRLIAQSLARKFKGGEVLALEGELGSGKTTFAKGLAQGLRIRQKITSPTFVICRPYPLPGKTQKTFYHFDLYRIKNQKELLELGFREIIADPENIVALEWPEKAKGLLPKNTIRLRFTPRHKADERVIQLWLEK